ncbi:hypothetical protein ZIOFF_001398 [Zingiber officinale]|uniref:chorismate synthase n=1 Tax=Zingiber officinale TaxID=94328 RepID=A0A8J5IK06_ZINOF|nr:hypothetical protein ZIOFF_001398 [Zingiber officinale]
MGSLSHERKYDTFAPPSSPCALKYIEHHVSKLDTLAGVAIKYGVEIADIKRTNGLTIDLQLFAHKILLIPLPGGHPPSTPIKCNGSLDDSKRIMNFGERNDPPHKGEKEVLEGAPYYLAGQAFVISGTLDSYSDGILSRMKLSLWQGFAPKPLAQSYFIKNCAELTTLSSLCFLALRLLLVFSPDANNQLHPVFFDSTSDKSTLPGGRRSARETIGRVAAGAIAKKILKMYAGTEPKKELLSQSSNAMLIELDIELEMHIVTILSMHDYVYLLNSESSISFQILAYVSQVHKVVLPEGVVDHETVTLDQIENNIVRCPDPDYAQKIIEAIDEVRVKGDSVGGIVTCIARNVPRGLGCPVFDKLEANLAKAMLSLPATKGFEISSGFAGTFLTGSEHNDEFFMDEHGNMQTRTNQSGGVQGGISNGETIYLRIAFKPTSTIAFLISILCVSQFYHDPYWQLFIKQKKQQTVTRDRHETELITRGRHDPCVVPYQ